MLFVETRFFIFFLAVFAVYWTLRANTPRKLWLLLCSHFFYACFFISDPSGDPFPFFAHLAHGEWSLLPDGWWFPAVLWASTCMDYVVGLGIAGAPSEIRRKLWLSVSVCVNIGVLVFFKYFNFFVQTGADFLGWVGLPASIHTLKIILPYGVSFYTFQSLSYSIDVYRRRLEPVRRFLDLAFFISFFPQLVAGPIVRATTFLPQLVEKRRWAGVDVRGAATLFFIGFVKKACVSEFAGHFADRFFDAPQKYTHGSAWIGMLYYAAQIYCDFSGYSDMAIATARLLGYELTLNFDFPLFSRSVTEFWRRWHISLSTWLRDYVYISLGGNRGTRLFLYRNLMLTMLLCGLWHGAAWHYVVMGGLNGLALILHREWTIRTENGGAIFKRVIAVVALPLSFYWTCITYIYFRAAPTISDATGEAKASAMQNAWYAWKAISFGHQRGKRTFDLECVGILLVLAFIHWLNYRGLIGPLWRRLPGWVFAALLGIGTVIAIRFVPTHYKPFVYFQF